MLNSRRIFKKSPIRNILSLNEKPRRNPLTQELACKTCGFALPPWKHMNKMLVMAPEIINSQ